MKEKKKGIKKSSKIIHMDLKEKKVEEEIEQEEKVEKKQDLNDKKEKEEKEISKDKNRSIYTRRKEESKDMSFEFAEVLLLMFVSIVFGIVTATIYSYSRTGTNEKISKEAQEILKVYQDVENHYSNKMDKKKVVDGAIKGIINSLDDENAAYMTADEAEQFQLQLDGKYVGIGSTVSWGDGVSTIIEVYKDSPSDKAGLQSGDVIVAIDGTEVKNVPLEQVSSMLKLGGEGTSVTLKIARGEEEKEVVITRGLVVIPSVTSKYLDGIGYLKISTFASNTFQQFEKALKSLEKKNIHSLIIDVRGNTGGHLSQAREILDLFMKKGTILYQVKGDDKVQKVVASTKESRKYPVVILVDYSSASASEVLATSFSDNYSDVSIVGTTTYGKGTIQEVHTISTGATLKYTTKEWLTSKGKSINQKGLKPTYSVDLSDEYYNNPSNDTDNQFQKALELLQK